MAVDGRQQQVRDSGAVRPEVVVADAAARTAFGAAAIVGLIQVLGLLRLAVWGEPLSGRLGWGPCPSLLVALGVAGGLMALRRAVRLRRLPGAARMWADGAAIILAGAVLVAVVRTDCVAAGLVRQLLEQRIAAFG
jgi:hypothetical protein